MRIKHILLVLLLLSSNACAFSGGSQQFPYVTGYSFRDKVNQNFAGNYNWKGAQIVNANRAVAQGIALPSRFPNSTVMWTIQPGDNPIGDGTNRNEVLQMFNTSDNDENGSSGTQYYGYSLYVPSAGWTCPVLTPFFVVMQLHGPDSDGLSPAFSLDLCNFSQTNHYIIETNGGEFTSPTKLNTDLGPIIFDQWQDFLFEVTWAIDNTGQVTVWERSNLTGVLTQTASYNTPTLYASGGVAQNHYWKSGIYRIAGLATTITVYEGPLSRATNMQDAATAAFNQWP